MKLKAVKDFINQNTFAKEIAEGGNYESAGLMPGMDEKTRTPLLLAAIYCADAKKWGLYPLDYFVPAEFETPSKLIKV